jgi:hypothetical protein
MTNQQMLRAAPLALALVLTACGGGGYDAPPPQAADPLVAIPASASQSVSGMVSYMQSVQPLDAEAHDPVSLDAYSAPIADEMEPIALGA